MTHLFTLVAIAALAADAADTAAVPRDTFLLANGGQLVGRLLNKDEIPRKTYQIELNDGAKITLVRSDVSKIVRQSEAEAEYERLRPNYPDTVEGHLQLAAWCQQHGLGAIRKAHLRRAVELEPNQAEARKALGYRFIEGKWLTHDEHMQELGHVRYNRTWKSPQEIEVLERQRKDLLAEREWFKRIEDLKHQLGTSDAPAAIAALKSINDPYAFRALNVWLTQLLGGNRGARQQTDFDGQLLLVDVISQIRIPAVQTRLAEVAILSESEEVRQSALGVLKNVKSPQSIEVCLKALHSKSNREVNRAAVALAKMEAVEATGALIEALSTRHVVPINPGGGGGGGYTATFIKPDANGVMPTPGPGQTTGTSFGTGNAPTTVERMIQNVDVRDSLIALTRVNYDFDERAWRGWLAAQKKPTSLDARRDPQK